MSHRVFNVKQTFGFYLNCPLALEIFWSCVPILVDEGRKSLDGWHHCRSFKVLFKDGHVLMCLGLSKPGRINSHIVVMAEPAHIGSSASHLPLLCMYWSSIMGSQAFLFSLPFFFLFSSWTRPHDAGVLPSNNFVLGRYHFIVDNLCRVRLINLSVL